MITQFMKRFPGHPGMWGRGFLKDAERNKYGYAKVIGPVDETLYDQHLLGDFRVGVYNFDEQKRVRWFCVDVDIPKGEATDDAETDFATALPVALEQVAAFDRAGLFVYLERSRSGKGAHVWGFLNDWLPAADVRRAILPLVLQSKYVDRGKIYPADPNSSEHGVLIGLPYFPDDAARGHGVFLHPDTLEPLPLDDFLGRVAENAYQVIERMARDAPELRTTPQGDVVVELANGGRPDPLLPTGALKLISQYGCSFMHHAYVDRHELTEPEWYAALGQLTAFERGREIAHLMWRDYRHYSPGGMDAKFAQAAKSPPVGCAFIHERFPEHACKGCPMKAPYHRAALTVQQLVRDAVGDFDHGGFDDDLERIWEADAGTALTGVVIGQEGFDDHLRFRNDQITVLAAQPSMGKTAFALHAGLEIAKQTVPGWDFTIPVFFLSTETGKNPLRDRILAHEADVDSLALKGERKSGRLTADEKQRLRDAAARLNKLHFYEHYTAGDAEQIITLIETKLIDIGYPFFLPYIIIFDYLQHADLTHVPGDKEHEKLANVMRSHKRVQRVLQHPWITLSQTTREQADTDEPKLTGGAGTRVIEQITDQYGVITGEYMPGPEAPRTLHLLKNKEGVVGVVIDMIMRQAVSQFIPKPKQQLVAPTPLPEGQDPFGQFALAAES